MSSHAVCSLSRGYSSSGAVFMSVSFGFVDSEVKLTEINII